MAGTRLLWTGIGLTCMGATATPSFADFDKAHPPHHAFNAQLLQPGELQFSIAGNVKYGVLDTLELGTQAGFLMIATPPVWNLSLKHRMFETPDSFTSFTAHSFFQSEGSDRNFFSMHGIINSRPIGSSDFILSLGLFDANLISYSSDSNYTVHFLTPSIAFDAVLSKHWAVSLIGMKPVYAIGELNSEDSGEGNLQIDFTKNKNTLAYTTATVTYSGKSWNAEIGAFSFSTDLTFFPYLNLFWRFHAN